MSLSEPSESVFIECNFLIYFFAERFVFENVVKICQLCGGRIYLSPTQAICPLSLGIRPSYVPIQITLYVQRNTQAR